MHQSKLHSLHLGTHMAPATLLKNMDVTCVLAPGILEGK